MGSDGVINYMTTCEVQSSVEALSLELKSLVSSAWLDESCMNQIGPANTISGRESVNQPCSADCLVVSPCLCIFAAPPRVVSPISDA